MQSCRPAVIEENRSRTKGLGIVLFALWLLAGGVAGLGLNRAVADALVDLDPEVARVVSESHPLDFVPVVLYFDEQGLAPSSVRRAAALGTERRRTALRAELKDLAIESQSRLRLHLEKLERRGQARSIRSLWMVNAIAVEVMAPRVYDLLEFGELRRVQWDPEVPLSEMIDGLPQDGPREAHYFDTQNPTIPWNVTKVRAPECWGQGITGAGILVAVIDSGVDYLHPDLADHIFSNPGEVPGDTLDNDNNGKIDDIRGWDFVNEDNDPMDVFPYHGTAVAGIVAGDGTGGQSTGIAPNATILPIRASGGQWSDIFEALDYAVDMDVDIIQMSVSQKWQGSPKPDYAAWRTTVENELALGYVHSNSIGNQGASLHTDPIPFNISAPGNCPSPWLSHFQYSAGGQTSVIAVGATTNLDLVDEASGRGPSEWNDIGSRQPEYPYPMPQPYQDYPYWGDNPGLLKPDLCAPGPGAMSLDEGTGYRAFSGTSAATPHVAGAMALLLQANPTLSPETLDMVLQTTAVDLGVSGKDTVYGAGRLDCYAALLKVQQLHTYAYLQGTVRNAVTLDTIPRAQVTISTLPSTKITANSIGGYRLHVRQGLFTVIASAFGYEADTISVTVPGDTIIERDFALHPILTGILTGVCTSSLGDTLADVRVRIKEAPYASQLTGPLGTYVITDVPIGIPLTLEAVKFNHAVVLTPVLLDSTVVDTIDVALPYGLHDDFELDQGWTRSLDDEAAYGLWERGDPNATYFGTTMVQPEDDASASGTQCYLTGNSIVGASQSYNDVTGGVTTLLSPVFDATVYHNPVLNYRRWFSMDTGTTDTDSLLVSLSNDGGQSWVDLDLINTSDRNWTARSYEIATFLAVSDSMQIRVRTADNGGPSIVEAAVDEFLITENTSDVVEDPGASGLAPSFHLAQAAPNPFRMGTGAAIRFALPTSAPTKLSVYDIQGRRVVDLVDGTLTAGAYVATWDGRDRAGRRCGAGLYLYRLTQGKRTDEGRVILMR